ncbi:2Fe-2S iron-sulfur cluster-binding protein [Propionibacteriaceae bacterium Y1700]|uniref:2Fe-2S iron-sulfur cluster-binding protein n=1 Tax=Microlunatus sp. Y1700 TaxID=3418487 RepID=UPI003DA73C79
MPATFHPLRVAELTPTTDDAVVITFEVPAELSQEYAFRAGQHLTIRTHLHGVEERRSYSICAAPSSGRLQIGVKLLPGGAFSTFVHDQLAVGDQLDVMTPAGRFSPRDPTAEGRHYGAVVAGSGITPVMSIMAEVLRTTETSTFTLLYGNRGASSVMFAEEIADLKDTHPDRLQVFHVLSRELHASAVLAGRMEGEKLITLLDHFTSDDVAVDEWFLCGPYAMVTATSAELTRRGLGRRQVHSELFWTGEVEPPQPTHREQGAQVTARLDGRTTSFSMPAAGSVLDAVLAQRPEAPFACKGGVCGTCRVKVISGEVEMARNHALDPQDLEAGFRLACQSVPVTDELTVDFDA